MTSRAAAARYARALFDVIVSKRDPAGAHPELTAFAELVGGHDALARVAANPALPASRKRAIVRAIIERTTPSDEVGKLLLLLAERDRLTILPEVVEAYRSRLLEHQRIVRAEVTTAVPIGETQRTALEKSLAQATGRTLMLAIKVDPAIIGGAVTKVGSVVYDGSIARQLEKLKEQLAEA
ncbi:MAG: F0F1 ATP synthase subunit delta [Vicinamibacterales bacterium]